MSYTLMTLIYTDDRVETVIRDSEKGTCESLARFSFKDVTDQIAVLQTLSGDNEVITPDRVRQFCNTNVIQRGLLPWSVIKRRQSLPGITIWTSMSGHILVCSNF